jgi:hypothetical protein
LAVVNPGLCDQAVAVISRRSGGNILLASRTESAFHMATNGSGGRFDFWWHTTRWAITGHFIRDIEGKCLWDTTAFRSSQAREGRVMVRLRSLRLLVSYVGGEIEDALPGWAVGWIVTPQKVASQVELDLRQVNPISITLTSETIPSIAVYVRLTNQSRLHLVLDRLLIELSVGQPAVNSAMTRRYELPARHSRDVLFMEFLDSYRRQQIEDHVVNGRLSVPIQLYLTAYFDSKVGIVPVERRFEHFGVLWR